MKNRSIKLNITYISVFLYMIFGNALTFNLGDRLPIKVGEILIFVSTVLILLKYRINKIYVINYYNMYFIWIFMGITSASILTIKYNLPISELIYGLLYPARICFLLFCLYFMILYLNYKGVPYIKIVDGILVSFVIVSLIGFIQLIIFPTAFDWYDVWCSIGVYCPNPDPHIGRLLSTYFDPNYLGSILSIPATIALAMYIYMKKKKYFIYFGIISLALLLTVSRSAILALVLSIGIYFLLSIEIKKSDCKLNGRLFILLIFMFIAVIVYLCLNPRLVERIFGVFEDKSAGMRIVSWKKGLEIIKENIGLGIGNNMTGAYNEYILGLNVSASTGYGNDSSLIFVLITTGLIGLIFYLVSFFVGFKELKNLKLKKYKFLRNIIISITVSSIVASFFNNLLFYPLWLYLYILFFISTVIYLKSGKELL